MHTSVIVGLICLITAPGMSAVQETSAASQSSQSEVPPRPSAPELSPPAAASSSSSGVLPGPQEAGAAISSETATPNNDREEAESWLLRYKFHTGQTFRYEMEQTMTLSALVSEKKNTDLSELKQRRRFTVQSTADDGSARLTMQFEHVWMLKKIDEQESVVFDSSMKTEDVPAAFRQVAHDLKGVAPRYWLSSTGTSLHATAGSTVLKASNKVGGESDPQSGNVENAVLNTASLNSDQKNASDPGSFLMQLPESSLKIGDSWKETIVVPVRLPHDITVNIPILRTSRLESVEDGIARISFRCSIESGSRNPLVRSQLIQATPRGDISFDIERGLMLRREMRYDESVFGVLGAESVISSVGKNVEVLLEAATEK